MTNCTKTALVTGAAHKIGRAIAEHLLDRGYALILHAHTAGAKLKEWVSAHEHGGLVLGIIEADLSLESGQNALIEQAFNHTSSLNLLVNNASAFSPKSFKSITRSDYQKMLAINLDAPFFITQGLLPLFAHSLNPSVVNIVDAMWQRPLPGFAHYAISKAALAVLTKTLGVELAPKVRINAVAPGAISFQPFFSQKVQAEFLKRIPQGHVGSFADIARAVIYLHEQALYAVGEILVIDGGRSIA